MNHIKAAIFDLDGTIIDSMYVWKKVDVDFLTQRGIPVTKEYTEAVRGMFFRTAAEYTRTAYGLSESVDEIVQCWLDMAHEEYAHHVRLKPYIREYLDVLKSKGIKLGMATSSDPYLLEPVLKSNGIRHYFDEVCYTSEVGRNKSYPDIYRYTARKLGVSERNCMVFEDIPEGIDGANKAEMYTVAVYDEASKENEDYLRKAADQYIFDFSDMLEGFLCSETASGTSLSGLSSSL